MELNPSESLEPSGSPSPWRFRIACSNINRVWSSSASPPNSDPAFSGTQVRNRAFGLAGGGGGLAKRSGSACSQAGTRAAFCEEGGRWASGLGLGVALLPLGESAFIHLNGEDNDCARCSAFCFSAATLSVCVSSSSSSSSSVTVAFPRPLDFFPVDQGLVACEGTLLGGGGGGAGLAERAGAPADHGLRLAGPDDQRPGGISLSWKDPGMRDDHSSCVGDSGCGSRTASGCFLAIAAFLACFLFGGGAGVGAGGGAGVAPRFTLDPHTGLFVSSAILLSLSSAALFRSLSLSRRSFHSSHVPRAFSSMPRVNSSNSERI